MKAHSPWPARQLAELPCCGLSLERGLVDASTVYGWDGASRLTSLGFNLSGTSQDATWTLGYNPAGQVVSRALSNSAYAYTADPNLSDAYTINGLNQVTAVDTTSVIYDGRGNITGDGTSTWTYDSTNRIVSGGASTLAYDPAGRLAQITATGVDNRFLYAGAQAIGEYNGSGGLISRYVPGAGLDDYAAYTSGTGGSITRSWPMADPLGSVAAIADAAGAAIKINRYDEYGVPQSVFSGRFGYAGAMSIEQAGTAPWNMRNRQYHPTLGRFLQTDPIGIAGGINLYAYVGNDPVNMVDPLGLTDDYWVRSTECQYVTMPNGDIHAYCRIVYTVVRLNWSPSFENFGSLELLRQQGLSNPSVVGPYCPSRPVDPRISAGARAANAGNLAHGAIQGGLVGIARHYGEHSSASAIGRSFLPMTIILTSAEMSFTVEASSQRGEPPDVVAARALLPAAGAIGGGVIGGGAGGFLGGPVGGFLGGAGLGAAGAEGGTALANEYAQARGCQ